jgi:hypothetical protein
MTRLTHKKKIKMARKMRTHPELVEKVSIWSTKAWTRRAQAIRDRVARKIEEKKHIFVVPQQESKIEGETWVKETLWQRIKKWIKNLLK